MKNIYWVGHSETNNVTLLYRANERSTWFSFVFQKDEEMPEPKWAGWYPVENMFVKEISKDTSEDYYKIKDSGKYGVAFINAIFEDRDFRLRIRKDFEGGR